MGHRNLVVDLNNNVFMIRHATIKTPKRNERREQFVKELIFKELVKYVVTFANEHKCDSIVIACDSPKVWRKDLYLDYKDSSHEDVYYEDCIEAANLAKEFFRTCTNSIVLEVPHTEADDIIAIYCNESEGVENIILSSDKDFMQLINERTRLYSPPQKKFREAEDPQYELFFKCIRGDRNDNIDSAYPRVRETKLKEAWDDPMAMQNLLETVRRDGKKVGECYDFNKKLIDLTMQPDWVKNDIRAAITTSQSKNFGEMRVMAFFGKNNLKKFSDMLTYKERPLRGQPKWKMV